MNLLERFLFSKLALQQLEQLLVFYYQKEMLLSALS